MRPVDAILNAQADTKARRQTALAEKAKADAEAARWADELADIESELTEQTKALDVIQTKHPPIR